MSLSAFHPIIEEWFTRELGTPTDIQKKAWPLIRQGKHVLVTAPTGCGKTLTAFLWAIHQLISGAWEVGQTRVLYVSPMSRRSGTSTHERLPLVLQSGVGA